MAGELINIADQFKGLPMGDLIGGPLTAACDAQIRLAKATSDFIQTVGFLPTGPDDKGASRTRQVAFSFTRPTTPPEGAAPGAGNYYEEKVELSVPLLSIVKIPNLSITTVDVIFDMEVKSSFASKETNDATGSFDATASYGFGMFSATVHIQGSVASHKENTRSSDNSAKYHVQVHAQDAGMPEGLARVMDILQSAVAPRKVSPPAAIADATAAAA
jgi:hypothetical protein